MDLRSAFTPFTTLLDTPVPQVSDGQALLRVDRVGGEIEAEGLAFFRHALGASPRLDFPQSQRLRLLHLVTQQGLPVSGAREGRQLRLEVRRERGHYPPPSLRPNGLAVMMSIAPPKASLVFWFSICQRANSALCWPMAAASACGPW